MRIGIEKENIQTATDRVVDVDGLVISRLDYFAAHAMQGLLANSFQDGQNQPLSLANSMEIASMARDQAKHLIKALEI
ncbi:MAG: hypothetical protein GY718_09675 [Lentisphaerae bacterium]|nr:hypothetical protein [Lentisphaerota bacterium]